jgi:D-alanyl-D-alanine dipeptidase
MKTDYFELEKNIPRYQDLIPLRIRENNELFVKLDKQIIPYGYSPVFSDMKELIGENIFVRKTVAEKLKLVQTNLQKKYPNYSLFVTFGFRDLRVQTKRFLNQLGKQTKFFPNPNDLYEEVHRYIAVPTVAGHPTGGAIDIVIVDRNTKKPIDFGSKQYDYTTKNNYVFVNSITQKQKENRMLLRRILIKVNFAPYDSEWWHFSYGDREWAYYYKKPYALYGQKTYGEIENIV